jgi:hypothetical protein
MHRHGVRSGISGESNFAAFLYKRPQQLSHSQTILARAQPAVPQPDYPTVYAQLSNTHFLRLPYSFVERASLD